MVSMPRISHSSKEENNKGNPKLSRIGLSGIREGIPILSIKTNQFTSQQLVSSFAPVRSFLER